MEPMDSGCSGFARLCVNSGGTCYLLRGCDTTVEAHTSQRAGKPARFILAMLSQEGRGAQLWNQGQVHVRGHSVEGSQAETSGSEYVGQGAPCDTPLPPDGSAGFWR